MDRRKFIALPNKEALHLTPKLWIAVGLIAYNYHLMTLEALQILTTSAHAHPRTSAESSPSWPKATRRSKQPDTLA